MRRPQLFRLLLCAGLALTTATLAAPSSRADSIGSAIGTKPYSLSIQAPAAKRGQPAVTKLIIKPGSGYHLNMEFPLQLKLTGLPEGVTTPKATLGKDDAKKLTEGECTFEISLVSRDAGKKTIAGELRFAVCTATTCDPQKTPISIELNVSP